MSIETWRRKSEIEVLGEGMGRLGSVAVLIGMLAIAAGCGSDAEETRFGPDDPEYEGVSLEELERHAEPMTLEEAERLGIIDTTIRIEAPINPDSLQPGAGGLVPRDSIFP